MKTLITFLTLFFSLSLFANDTCKVKFTIGSGESAVQIEELVCKIEGAESSEKYKDLYAACKNKDECKEPEAQSLQGDQEPATQCSDDKSAGKDVNKYKVNAQGNVEVISQ